MASNGLNPNCHPRWMRQTEKARRRTASVTRRRSRRSARTHSTFLSVTGSVAGTGRPSAPSRYGPATTACISKRSSAAIRSVPRRDDVWPGRMPSRSDVATRRRTIEPVRSGAVAPLADELSAPVIVRQIPSGTAGSFRGCAKAVSPAVDATARSHGVTVEAALRAWLGTVRSGRGGTTPRGSGPASSEPSSPARGRRSAPDHRAGARAGSAVVERPTPFRQAGTSRDLHHGQGCRCPVYRSRHICRASRPRPTTLACISAAPSKMFRMRASQSTLLIGYSCA